MKERIEHLGQVSSHLTRRWAQHSAHAVQRYGSILAGYGRGELSVTAAGEALLRLVADEAKRYSEDAVEFSSDYFRAVLSIVGVQAPGVAKPRAAPGQQIDIQLTSRVGSQAARSFVLENKQERVAEISFLVSDFAGPAGTAPFHAPIEFEPARLTLQPHEEKTVQLRLPLDADHFSAGQNYRARIIVQGYDGLEIVLHLAVEPPAP
jgi:hypothetical protein